MNEVPELTIGPKKKSKLPLIIIAAVVVIGGGFGGYMMMGKSKSEPAKTEHASEEKGAAKAEKHGEAKEGEGQAASDVGEIVSLNELVVNPRNTRGGRFFVTNIGIVCNTKEQADEFKKREPLIRDRLITFFSLQTMEVISDINRREQIKTYVKAIIDREMKSGPVREILFSRYIVQ